MFANLKNNLYPAMNYTQLRIFLVDDDPFCLAVYQQYLNNIGYTKVHTYSNAEDCIKNLALQPDVIFTDFLMFPTNGLHMIKQVKKINPHIYIVAVSGYHDKDIFNELLNCGAFDFIIKGDLEWKQIRAVLSKIEEVRAVLEAVAS